jgi:hypothetical protein
MLHCEYSMCHDKDNMQHAGGLTFGHFFDTVLDELLRAVAKRELLPAGAHTAMT